MYKVMYNEKEGYVYSKYLVDTEDESKENYSNNGSYDIHLSRIDKYGGGDAAVLDFYPYEKKEFKDNELLKKANTFYINANVLPNIDSYIEVALKNGINAFVIDIKENTAPSYKSAVAKQYSMTTYNKAPYSIEQFNTYIKKIKDSGIYTIGT